MGISSGISFWEKEKSPVREWGASHFRTLKRNMGKSGEPMALFVLLPIENLLKKITSVCVLLLIWLLRLAY